MPLSSTSSGRLSLGDLRSSSNEGVDDAECNEFGRKLIAQMWADVRLKLSQTQNETLKNTGTVQDKIEIGASKYTNRQHLVDHGCNDAQFTNWSVNESGESEVDVSDTYHSESDEDSDLECDDYESKS